jgi:integrase
MDTSGSVWQYRPHHHKNEWRGHERVIDIGPKAQAILTQFKRPALSDAYIFSPTIAELRRRERQRAARKTPLWPSHLKAQDRKRKATRSRPPRDRYDVNSYRHAVVRACHRAGVAPWSPGQLRHNAATLIRQRFGLEGARAVLGHRLVETTQVYAERDRCISLDIAREVG